MVEVPEECVDFETSVGQRAALGRQKDRGVVGIEEEISTCNGVGKHVSDYSELGTFAIQGNESRAKQTIGEDIVEWVRREQIVPTRGLFERRRENSEQWEVRRRRCDRQCLLEILQ